MRKSVLTLVLSIVIITASACNVFGLELSANNFNELENVLIEQMGRYTQHFGVRYSGSLDNIEETLDLWVGK